jgi:hypothetical protein
VSLNCTSACSPDAFSNMAIFATSPKAEHSMCTVSSVGPSATCQARQGRHAFAAHAKHKQHAWLWAQRLVHVHRLGHERVVCVGVHANTWSVMCTSAGVCKHAVVCVVRAEICA